ncbi:TetR family transcriptional regulator [Dietzia sp. NCCP-2495]|uniref:TetR/AcrR family transcriptional regulator n=1 Tax=Dietzia sp. NCCP-2495 TaxID=2934675 RepID=UPI0022329D73|nr:TetR/AcrR family transcriptional regulator [Dietzia sp. NCCP-2495]GLB63217.1 TetR family transcriptional regulator [Dietzia sp. NCCP-2495]
MTSDFPDLSDLTPGARRILDVASRLFYEQGIHPVSVDTIAAESGVSKPVLYTNFGSKDGLVVAYLLDRHRWWWTLLEDEVARAESPRALAFFTVYAADHMNSRRGCAFLNAAAELPDDHPAHEVIRYHKHSICDLLEELVKEDSAPDIDHRMLGNHLFLLLEGAFAHRPIYGTEMVWQGREMAARLLARPEIVGTPAAGAD